MRTYTEEELKIILEKHLAWLMDKPEGNRANLDGASLDGANLKGANLYWASLDGASLKGASLDGASLDGASLDGANLKGANLYWASLKGASLDGANLKGANLYGASLKGASLKGASLDKRYIQVSCVGSRKGMTTYCFDDDVIWCGCFTGTLTEFEAKVLETHKDNKQYMDEYTGFINYLRSLK